MLQRLYVHNFRCLENFELSLKDTPSALLIGANGAGKSTIGNVLEIFQAIGRGINRMRDLEKPPLKLLSPKDFAWERTEIPMRFEIEILLDRKIYQYILALELPKNFKELRVFEEQFLVDGEPVYLRENAQITLHRSPQNRDAQFLVDWHLAALPLIQEQSETDPIRILKNWLSRTIVLAPIPSLITGDSQGETLEPKRDGSNLAEWVSGLLGRYPAAYTHVDRYLKAVMPDIQEFQNKSTGTSSKNIIVSFEVDDATLKIDFEKLSDGEKCFFLCAFVLAANRFYGPLFCFWDEPESHLSLSEVGHFIMSLRHSFKESGQILVTSHNPEAIRKFSDENTFILDRKNHLEHTLVRPLSALSIQGDLIDNLICGDIEV